MANRKTAVRICAICGRPGADAGFRTALMWLGVANYEQDKAHLKCVERLRKDPKAVDQYADPPTDS